jgi:hypothetical protein
MLPDATARAGYSVPNAVCRPNQKPKTTATITIIIIVVLKYSFFHNRPSVDVILCLLLDRWFLVI